MMAEAEKRKKIGKKKKKKNCLYGSGGSDERVEPIFLRPLLVGSNHLRWES